MSKERESAVSGTFYPSGPEELKAMVKSFLAGADVTDDIAVGASAFLAPHAGYAYSGQVAAYTYKALFGSGKDMGKRTFVIVGPSHYALSQPGVVSLSDWETPLGIAVNDKALSEKIAELSGFSTDDDYLSSEHSVEVQVPFLQTLFPGPKCCFICMSDQSLRNARKLSSAILKASAALKRDVVVIASSDMDHYEPADVAEGKDKQVLKAMEDLDAEALYRALSSTGDTMCGYGPAATAMLFAKEKGAKAGKLIKYSTSADSTKDFSSVVAYASMSF